MKMDKPEKKQILKERARLLAKEPLRIESNKKILEIVQFQIEKERYGIETQYIQKVQSLDYLTPIPGFPSFMRGIINVHGKIIPILDIKKFFDREVIEISNSSKAIIIHHQNATIGILADEVFGIIKVPENEFQKELPELRGIRSEYFKGITLSQTVVLDPIKLALDKKIVINDVI